MSEMQTTIPEEQATAAVITKTPRTDVWHVLFKQLIFAPEDNIRIKYKDIEELMYSIVAAGKVLKPLSVYRVRGSENFKVKQGNRRYLAVKLGIERLLLNPDTFRIRVIVDNPESEDERLFSQLEENTGGVPNTILEEAVVYARLSEMGYSQEDIAHKRKKSITHVRNCFSLLTAGPALRNLIIEDVVAETQIIKMLKNNTPAEVEKMIVDAIDFEKEKIAAGKPGNVSAALMLFGADDDIPTRKDNTKTSGPSGMDISSDSGPAIRITAKKLAKDKGKSERFHEVEVKNLIMSAMMAMTDWSQYSTLDATTLQGLTDQVEEWFRDNKHAEGGFRYFSS